MCGWVYGYHESKRSLGPLWIWRLCSYSPSLFFSYLKLSCFVIVIQHWQSTISLVISYGTKRPLSADVPLNSHSLIWASLYFCFICCSCHLLPLLLSVDAVACCAAIVVIVIIVVVAVSFVSVVVAVFCVGRCICRHYCCYWGCCWCFMLLLLLLYFPISLILLIK